MTDFFYGDVQAERLTLNETELSRRLMTEKGFENEITESCRKALLGEIRAKYSACRCRVSYPEENKIDLGFGAFESADLYKNLSCCTEVFVMALTLGVGVDRLINKYSLTSVSKCFIADALASAYAESLCDYVAKELRGSLCCRPRFSAGYGDLSLDIQPYLLELVDAKRLLNITLSEGLLMTPKKSITAIMGIEK